MSWRERPLAQEVPYADMGAVQSAARRLGELPPLVTSGEIEHLTAQLAEAEEGKRFVLWGGDCAESIADCTSGVIAGKLKILLQMSLVLVFAGRRPVTRVGRLAGQYAKPRSAPSETRRTPAGEVTLPSYFGDLVNRVEFTPEARTPDPRLMLEAYQHAGLTLNFVRSLIDAGFADIHHPEYWNLGLLQHAGLTGETRAQYQALLDRLSDAIEFMRVAGQKEYDALTRVDFFTSHEGLNLWYESAQTRTVPRRQGWWNLTTHLPWIGERTRRIDGAHVEYFRGVRNPVGVKVGPSITPDELLALAERLNPQNLPGKLVLMPRMGAKVRSSLGPMVEAMKRAGRRCLWVSDPMHGNGITTASGYKTRRFDDIMAEMNVAWEVLGEHGVRMGGVHVELTGDDVTECLGGSGNITEADLARNYATSCDPRLNYEQSLELAFGLARRMQA
jgi:3-deoxy-7-phosphoheptulonate synthase